MAVIGAGNNGVESALLALQAKAASVELIVRSRVRWFVEREPHTPRGALRQRLYRLAYPVVGFGPPPINRFALHPDAFALLPHTLRARLNARLLRPGAAPWLRRHVDGVIPISEGIEVTAAESRPDGLVLSLSDGTKREVDACIVACGFSFSRDGLSVLAPELRARVEIKDGWPVLDRAFRTSVPQTLARRLPGRGPLRAALALRRGRGVRRPARRSVARRLSRSHGMSAAFGARGSSAVWRVAARLGSDPNRARAVCGLEGGCRRARLGSDPNRAARGFRGFPCSLHPPQPLTLIPFERLRAAT